MDYLKLSEPSTPELGGFPIPTLLLVVGVLLGIGLALLCRVLVGLTARSRARSADRRLRKALQDVTHDLVVKPINAELVAYDKVRDGLSAALK
jgi:hypothetical protein